MTENWFFKLTGFFEADFPTMQASLQVAETTLRSQANQRTFAIGHFEMVALNALRARALSVTSPNSPNKLSVVIGDVRRMHQDPALGGALFQVASQFNALEMVGPSVTPEDGVTRYENDRTQGPACAIAAGAATIYRNYFVPIGDQRGQTATRQLDGLADLGHALSTALHRPLADLWSMKNGYALPTKIGLEAVSAYLQGLTPEQTHQLAGLLRVGLHSDVEVTDGDQQPGQLVSQIFCSALPVAYGRLPRDEWTDFAQLILNAAYEATLWAAVANKQRGRSNIVLLTLLGGGAFGNSTRWIYSAIRHALDKVQGHGLDIRLVSYGPAPTEMRQFVESYRSQMPEA